MGAMLRITRKEYRSADLPPLSSQCENGAEVRRMMALALVLDGGHGPRRRLSTGWIVRRCAIGPISTAQAASTG